MLDLSTKEYYIGSTKYQRYIFAVIIENRIIFAWKNEQETLGIWKRRDKMKEVILGVHILLSPGPDIPKPTILTHNFIGYSATKTMKHCEGVKKHLNEIFIAERLPVQITCTFKK